MLRRRGGKAALLQPFAGFFRHGQGVPVLRNGAVQLLRALQVAHAGEAALAPSSSLSVFSYSRVISMRQSGKYLSCLSANGSFAAAAS